MTICEFGPRDGEVIEIPDGSHSYRFPVMTESPLARYIEPLRRVDDTIRIQPNPRFGGPFDGPESVLRTVLYVVCEYRHPERHATAFALVSPEFLAASLR